MPAVRLTKRTVDAARPTSRTYVLYDDTLAGFGLRVTPAGSKSFVAEYRPNGGGRRSPTRRMTLGASTVITPDQARRAAHEILSAARLGEDPAAARTRRRNMPTFREFVERYLEEDAAAKLKQGTLANYKIYLRNHAAAELGSTSIDAITPADVARLHRKIGKTRPVTANRVIETLGSVFRYAVTCGVAPNGFNPAARIKAFKEHARERYLTTAELARLGAALHEAETIGIEWEIDETNPTAKHVPKRSRRTILGPHAVAAIRLLLLTGCRLREVLHLRWEHIDWERGLALLPDSKVGRRYVVLNAPALVVLDGLPRIATFVIPGEHSDKPRSDLNRPWRLISRRASLVGVRLHDLRHTHAAFGAGAGLGLPIIGKLLGHTSPTTTARYSHIDNDPLRRASERIGGAIANALEPATVNPKNLTVARCGRP